MALPRALNLEWKSNSTNPPHLIGGSDVYVAGSTQTASCVSSILDGANIHVVTVGDNFANPDIEMWKSTNPVDVAFTEQDAANAPGPASGGQDMVYEGKFDTGSDVWLDVDATAGTQTYQEIKTVSTEFEPFCSLVVRSSDLAAFYNDDHESNMGTAYARSGWSTKANKTTGAWTDRGYLGTNGMTDTHVFSPMAVWAPTGGRIHVIRQENDVGASTGAIHHASINGTTVTDNGDVGESPTLRFGAAREFMFSNGVVYTRASTERVRFLYVGDTSGSYRVCVMEFDEGASPSYTFEADIDGTNGTQESNGFSVMSLAVDSTTLHAMFNRSSDSDLYRADDGGNDTWGTVSSVQAGVMSQLSTAIYTRSGSKVFAYVYADTGAEEYDEVTLSGASPSGTGVLTFGPIAINASGAEEMSGSGAIAIEAIAIAAVGVMHPEGAGTVSLGPVAVDASGAEEMSGSGALDLGFVAIDASAEHSFLGSGTILIEAVAVDGVGVMHPEGTGAITLGPIEIVAAGVEEMSGAGALDLGSVAVDAVGVMDPEGAGALDLGFVAVASSATHGFEGAGAIAIDFVRIDAVGVMHPEGTGAIGLGPIALLGAGIEEFTGSGAVLISSVALDAVGVMHPEGTGAIVINAVQVAASGEEEMSGTGSLILGPIAIDASGEHVDAITGTGEIILSVLQVAASGAEEMSGAGTINLGSVAVDGAGEEEFSGAGTITFTPIEILGAGEEGMVGAGAIGLGPIEISGAGIESIDGVGTISLEGISIVAAGHMDPEGTGTVTIPAILVTGAGTSAVAIAFGEVEVAIAHASRVNVDMDIATPVTVSMDLASVVQVDIEGG